MPIIKPKELFFALITPSGSDKKMVLAMLKSRLENSGYDVKVIKLSKSLDMLNKLTLEGYESDYKGDEFKRIGGLMTAGTDCRTKMKRGDALALLAIADVVKKRNEKYTSNKTDENKYVAYLFDSLKHPDELETLRMVYGDALSAISVYTLRETRIRNYAKLFAGCTGESIAEEHRNKAEELVARDAKEQGEEGQNEYGLQIRKTFPLADLFVETTTGRPTVEKNIHRYIDTLLGYPYHTPSIDEYGMAMAVTSAVRSSDLSRQVGVSVVSKAGELITTGCNDVPKYGGGLYWPGQSDHRDYQQGYDSGTIIKNEALQDILTRYLDYLERNKDNCDMSEFKKNLKNEKEKKKLAKAMSGTLVRNILEFGRSVHAEMAALTEAARRGVPVKGATLYTTTFPCHLCSRHIISAGIDRVVYIEPFPKSLSGDLYSDSIVVDPSHDINGRVLFEPFSGVSPWHYHNFFKAGERKDDESGHVLASEKYRYRFFDRERGYRSLELYAISKYLDAEQANEKQDGGGDNIKFIKGFKEVLTAISLKYS